jgi:HTH-type transcriptional regulator/antitoxin HigA
MNSQTQFRPDYAVAPGEILDEHRESAGLTQADLAQRLGFSTKHINRIIGGFEPVTPETALKLESVFGMSASVWLSLEARFKEHQAREAETRQLNAEQAWLSNIPHRSMAKLGWIPEGFRGPDLVKALRSFFGVGSLDYLPNVWADIQAAYRKSDVFKSHEWALLAWLAKGEREAAQIQTIDFDATALRSALPEIKALSRRSGVEFVEPLVTLCANHGVALIFLPAPDGARACGATRWLDKDRALIQLSLRYKTDDQLWFTLFHEFGHVLLHGKREQFIDFDRGGRESEQEREADEFATKHLIQPNALLKFIEASDFSASAVAGFADSQDVSPGIVVGQLQHRRVIPFNSPLSRLKVSFRFKGEAV